MQITIPILHRCRSALRLLLFANVMMLGLVSSFRRSAVSNRLRLGGNYFVSQLSMKVGSGEHSVGSGEHSEIAIYRGGAEAVKSALNQLSSKRPQLEILYEAVVGGESKKREVVVWSAHCDSLQVDCTLLEPLFLGNTELSDEVTAGKWDDMLTQRLSLLDCEEPTSGSSAGGAVTVRAHMGDGGELQHELDTAIAAVQRSAFMSRSLQKNLLTGSGTISKDDKSPVTIADFAVQALVIHQLSRVFPGDRFIAEECSELIRQDKVIREGVLAALRSASAVDWDDEMLFDTVDLGGFEGSSERVWVLDPVDGTKGFMRREHYCIALALLVNGKPALSVLGCPNLHLENVLQPGSSSRLVPHSSSSGLVHDKGSVSYIEEGIPHPSPTQERLVFSPDTGSLFFAVTGRGAFCRSLSMPYGAAFEVQVSGCGEAKESKLCESAEATHGDRSTTVRVFSALELKSDFIRLDGQCKYCVVGSGAAEGNMRLPPLGYQEKIWDHAPGGHFILEAGGEITDLDGNRLDFSKGRMLDASVTGIIASNNLMHRPLLAAVAAARRAEEEEIIHGKQSLRPKGMN